MADSVETPRSLRWMILPAAALVLGGLWAGPAAADPGSGAREAARTKGTPHASVQEPVETAAGDPLGLHVFPAKFADFEQAVPAAPPPAQEPQLSPRELHREIVRWLGRWGAVEASPAR